MTAPTPTRNGTPRVTVADSARLERPTGAELAPPPKLRRRPLLIVAGVAAVCLGALLGVLSLNAVANAQDVIAARQTIQRGQVIDRDDLMAIKIGADPALQVIPAGQLDQLVGQRAKYDIVAGGVVTAEQLTTDPIPADGNSIVGISLSPGLLPHEQLRAGDPVRVVTTPGQAGQPTNEQQPEAIPATVVSLATDEMSGDALVNVEVSRTSAPRVASIAASGRAAVVLDDQEG